LSGRDKIGAVIHGTAIKIIAGAARVRAVFRVSFFKLIRKPVRDEKVRQGLTFHGLRHTAGKYVIGGRRHAA
jgi:hypothetical protein